MKPTMLLNTRSGPVDSRIPSITGALILIFFGLLRTAQAQDPGFSQFFASPLTLNPALTGKFELFKTTPHFDGTAANPKWLG